MTTWAAWIAAVLVLTASGTASASSVLLSPNSCQGKNTLESGLHRGSSAVSAEGNRGCGDYSSCDAAGLFVAPVRPHGIDLEALRPTETVAAHAAERPYINSPHTIRNIIESGTPRPDPGGVPGALRWDVPGSFRGSEGTFELVIDPATNRVLHFLFRSGRR
jgi:hypothetical protein